MKTVTITLSAAAVLAAVGLAAPARADDASYLDYLRSHGQNIMTYSPAENDWVTAGHFACGRMRNGQTPAQAVNGPWHAFRENGALVVEAAQHELCPDQL